MKVVVLQEGEGLQLLQGELRVSPQTGEIQVAVKACVAAVPPAKSRKLFSSNEYGRHHLGREVSGVIEAVGAGVEGYVVGGEVAVLLPLDSPAGGLAEFICVPHYWAVNKPRDVPHDACAAALRCGLLAYTALHYQHRTSSGDIILVTRGNFDGRNAIVQLARHWGARVLLPAYSREERSSLLELADEADILDLTNRPTALASVCLEATGGTGVDCVIDAGEVGLSGETAAPTKHDLISCLAANGKWVTMVSDLQLDPPDSQLLYWKGGSICFLNEFVWGLSGTQQGRLLHVLADVVAKVQSKVISTKVNKTCDLETLQMVDTDPQEAGVTIVATR